MLSGCRGGGKLLLTRSALPASAGLGSGLEAQRPSSQAGQGWESFHLRLSGGITSTSEVISIAKTKQAGLVWTVSLVVPRRS